MILSVITVRLPDLIAMIIAQTAVKRTKKGKMQNTL